MINFALSNLKLEGEKLHYKLKKPFDELINLSKSEKWWAVLDTVRTESYSEIINLQPTLQALKLSLDKIAA